LDKLLLLPLQESYSKLNTHDTQPTCSTLVERGWSMTGSRQSMTLQVMQ
jgi:hypothetical protein